MAVVPGRLEVTTHHLYFYDGSSEKEETEEGENSKHKCESLLELPFKAFAENKYDPCFQESGLILKGLCPSSEKFI